MDDNNLFLERLTLTRFTFYLMSGLVRYPKDNRIRQKVDNYDYCFIESTAYNFNISQVKPPTQSTHSDATKLSLDYHFFFLSFVGSLRSFFSSVC